MTDIKQQFAEMKRNMPRSVQWLLLAAAFIIVVILLVLIFTGKKDKGLNIRDYTKPELRFTPETVTDLSAVPVGTTKNVDIIVNANVPTKINVTDMSVSQGVPGLSVANTCNVMERGIDAAIPCKISVTFTPVAPMAEQLCSVNIEYRPQNAPAEIPFDTTSYAFTIGAVANPDAASDDIVAKNAPYVSAPETPTDTGTEIGGVTNPQPLDIPDDIYESDPLDDFDDSDTGFDYSKPDDSGLTNITRNATNDDSVITGGDIEMGGCSDFSSPGYNAAGRQIGWIKPQDGQYYFYPLSDKSCSIPTGIYNPDNGLITDINDRSKRIGSDSEHVGYSNFISDGVLPQLSGSGPARTFVSAARATNEDQTAEQAIAPGGSLFGTANGLKKRETVTSRYVGSSNDAVYSTEAYDRRFILRQYKPIPATIVSDVRADASMYDASDKYIQLPVRATVDRNVYADNGRTIILPTGTLMLGYVTGSLPGPYTAIGRMQIKWYQFILPNGVEFNFQDESQDAFSADSQGRIGVPGRGSTDYMEQFVMPMITALVPAAVNMIAPIADTFVNQIDLDNNTVVQSGTMRSSELAKNEIITAWNQVAQKLMVDMMDNTVPPFSIPAGTRITVYSPEDLVASCGTQPKENEVGKICKLTPHNVNQKRRSFTDIMEKADVVQAKDGSWVGQVRSFDLSQFRNKWCIENQNGALHADPDQASDMAKQGYDFSTVEMFCQSQNYEAINNARQAALFENQKNASNPNSIASKGGVGSQTYNEQVLGLKYNEDGTTIKNPFTKTSNAAPAQDNSLKCLDGTIPDANGCCTGELYQYVDNAEDMCPPNGYCCCPGTGGDCFPPIQ